MRDRSSLRVVLAAAALSLGTVAHAQSSATDYPWSVEFAIGWSTGIRAHF